MQFLFKAFLFTCPLFLAVKGLSQPLFEPVPSNVSGITFKNQLIESPKSNVLTYEYFFNGGGVAIGDINNDGLDDIYFTANMKPNKLYLNQGNFKFKDITEEAGVVCPVPWKTGVTMADINGDGFLDIYVCYSGKGDPEKRRNKLFINNGNLTFTEKSKEYGLDDPSHSTHASFFDYDKDGDLDLYLLNHNVVVIREFEFAKAKETRHPYAGDKLFRNDNGKYVDVSEAAGIKGSPLGFGLGVTVADINQDGWQDIYVSNDYIEPDYLYINNRDGTFSDKMTDYMQHISYFSMGCDVSDINNDGWVDIFTVDMLPESNKRQKLLYGPENYEHFALMVLNGFYFQNMRNMLHLNNRNGTYSEIGQFAGISNTDWSWAPLFADYDNDGWKDLFVTNGYYRDYTNRDFLKYKGDYYFERGRAKQKADTFHLVSTMTSTPLHNYIFRNNGDLTFTDKSNDWGFSALNFSSGGSYSDLDNDGDLDLVTNNQNETAGVYRNFTQERNPTKKFLKIKLKGSAKNLNAIGSKVYIHAGGMVQYYEMMSTRGFQSTVSSVIHVGLGTSEKVDSVVVKWPFKGETVLRNVAANQLLNISYEANQDERPISQVQTQPIFTKVETLIPYEHVELGFNDFKRQPLLMTMLTTCGPVMTTADVNGDGNEDVFVGGTQDNPGKLYFQTRDGDFVESVQFNLVGEKICTDADAAFFDADGDKDQDLYVVSGGYNDYTENDPALQDRLYINDGRGNFSKSKNSLEQTDISKSAVAPADFDKDGDMDLFVGGRVIPGKYPEIPRSFLLRNNGKGVFENVSSSVSPMLANIGMVTDANWIDFNKDGWLDLIVVGEFMAIEIFLNKEGKTLERGTNSFFNEPMEGGWTKMLVHDFDKDGDEDIIVGNFGLNSQLKASVSQPLSMVYKDFDKNGSIDPFLIYYVEGKPYPFASRDELLDQMYSMRPKYTSYASYADVQLENLFTKEELKDAKTLKATTLETVYLENANGKLIRRRLPGEAQFSPAYAMTTLDFNSDGNMDFVLGGNQSSIRIRMGVIDASFGQLFQGDGKGNFSYVPQEKSGLSTTGDIKSMRMLNTKNGSFLMLGVNNVGVQSYRLNGKR